MNRILILVSLGLLTLSSCKKEFTLIKSGDDFSINEFDFSYLSSRAKMNYNNGENKISATANFRIEKGNIIWISISPGLGVEVVRVLITKEKIQAMDKLKNNYYEFDYRKLSEQYGVEISYELIESTLVGNVLFQPNNRREITGDKSHYLFQRTEGSFGVNHYIGILSKKLEKLSASDAITNNSILVNYADFQEIEGQLTPQSINAVIKFADEKRDDTTIEIAYNRTTIQKEPLNFPFNVPDKYTRK